MILSIIRAVVLIVGVVALWRSVAVVGITIVIGNIKNEHDDDNKSDHNPICNCCNVKGKGDSGKILGFCIITMHAAKQSRPIHKKIG